MTYETFDTNCVACGTLFSYARRQQTRGRFAGNWMGAPRKYCSDACRPKRLWNSKSKKTSPQKYERNALFAEGFRLLGVSATGGTVNEKLTLLVSEIKHVVADSPVDEIDAQQRYIDVVDDMLELGMINQQQHTSMLKITNKWS